MPPTLDLSRTAHAKGIIPPRINLRRAASYNHADRGPLSSTSSRFNFNHLVFSPPPSPGLPSLSPPVKKPKKKLLGIGIRPLRLVKHVEMVSQKGVPDFATPIVITDHRGRAKWTVSIPPGSPFPLPRSTYADMCEKCEQVADRARELRSQSPLSLGFGSESPDHDFIDVQEAEKAGYLSGSGHDLGRAAGFSAAADGTVKPVCKKSLTFILESNDAGLGKSLMMLWTAYGLAQKEGRNFFVDDSRWAYGKYADIFQPPPIPDCSAPPSHERLPCPRQARHLVTSTATAEVLFGEYTQSSDPASESYDHAARKTQFALARRGYDALFELNKDDQKYVNARARKLMAKRIVPKTKGQQHGLAVGVHVRRGDRHPFEYQYRRSYLPLSTYADVANKMIDSKSGAARDQSFVILASDDPMVYETSSTSPGDTELARATRAQDRIKLASKQAIQEVNPPDKSVMHKFVDETFGWEGGFFAAMFWNLGQPSSSGIARKVPTTEASRLRSLVGRAYMMDLAVLADASDVVVCTVSAFGCRLLAVMMGWEDAIVKKNWINVDGDYGAHITFAVLFSCIYHHHIRSRKSLEENRMGFLQDVAGPSLERFSQLGLASQIVVGTAAFLAITVFLNVMQQVLFKKPNEPPMVFHLFPLIGSTITYGMDPPTFFDKNRKKYGDVFTFILLGKKTTVYVGPKGNDFILNGKIKDVCAEEIYTVLTTPVFGKDVVYDCPNSKLMEQKKFMKIALTTEAFRSYVPIISDEVTSYFKRTPDFKGQSGVVNICPKMAQITIFTASHALQGKDIRDQFDEKLADLYHDLDMGFSPINFMLHWAPLPWNNRRDHAQRTVAKIYMDTIKRRRANPETEAQDMMFHLMNSSYKNGVQVPDHEISHMMIALLMAGQHSSSSTSAWIMLRLASRPDIMEDLYQEQIHALGKDLPPLTYEDLAKLPLNQAIVKETLRLHAPIHSIMRAVKSPMPVPGTKYVIPTDHVLLAAPGVSATDSQYFPEPDLWEPHRWEPDHPLTPSIVRNPLNEEDDEKIDYGYGLVSKGAGSPYLPFGAGRHRCIGEQFANVQLQTIVAEVVRLFKFRNVDGSDKVIGTDYASLFSRPLEPANIYWERRN
ncbi:cytochrome P450 [Podospora australis]|uniref:Cytochrome P450 n=1 Tax=Podospora australis TaxID=1536484 RepID=A0AAN6X5T5_9PEZI|nr:cytochrome P450 [Podospora australis]